MLDNHLENELEGKSERGTNTRLYGCALPPLQTKEGPFPGLQQWVISAAPSSHSDCTQGAKPFLDANPFTLLKEHCSWV